VIAVVPKQHEKEQVSVATKSKRAEHLVKGRREGFESESSVEASGFYIIRGLLEQNGAVLASCLTDLSNF
jgi:hypothetical protein